VESLQSPDGKETVLAILDRPVEPDRLAERAGKDGPEVQFISLEAYETIRRLEAVGQLAFSSGPRRTLYERQATRDDDEHRRRLSKARKLLEKAEHLHRMASFLASGGFAAEVGTRAGEIAVHCLNALAVMTPAGGSQGDETPAEICERLGNSGALPAELHYQILSICELAPDDLASLAGGTRKISALTRVSQLRAHARAAVAA